MFLMRLFAFLLLLGAGTYAQAAEKFCSQPPFNGVIDGNVLANAPTQLTIDTNCTFKNWPQSKPLTTTINFHTNDPSIYLIIFDNVWYDGNLACANIPHKLWVVNSPEGAFSGACQDIMIPTETVAKMSPGPSAAVGVPFTYTLTLPAMTGPYGAGGPSSNDLGSIMVKDDLNATGAALTLVGTPEVKWNDGTVIPGTFSASDPVKGGVLTFNLPNIPAGKQITIKITVVPDDTNAVGTLFTNTANWQFSRWIDINEDGIEQPNEFFNPLPGEAGISAQMKITAPDFVVRKTSTETALNMGVTASFTIKAQNTGGADAWNVTIVDQLPNKTTAPITGMCPATAPAVSVQVLNADSTVARNLDTIPGAYTIGYTNDTGTPACQLTVTTTTAGGAIAPNQYLAITYQAQLDLDTAANADGIALTNIAGATRWQTSYGFCATNFNGVYKCYPYTTYNKVLGNGTPGVDDYQDAYTITTALAGYYFQKTVQNLTSHANPTTTASAGDKLRYKLRLFNVTETINGVTIKDVLDPAKFDLSTFAIVVPSGYATLNDYLAALHAQYTLDPTSGLLTISGNPTLDVAKQSELAIEFDITLKSSGLGASVSNQASLTSTTISGTVLSDDPYVNGVSPPSGVPAPDATIVLIQTPGLLSKANPINTNAAIGEQFKYTIRVPATPTAVPLYDVRILDTLPANVRFVGANVVSGGSWTLSNVGTSNSLEIIDAITGIDIPAYGQAIIEITVQLLNNATNDSGVSFSNSASYKYNRANGDGGTETGTSVVTAPDMTVAEPAVTSAVPATKTVHYVGNSKLPTDPAEAGNVLEYVITIPNSGNSTAFDTNVVDTLPATVSLVPDSATATIDGIAITGFVKNPVTLTGGALAWGRENNDGSLDIPPGKSLVLTYRVTVVSVGQPITNSARVDWTSLDGDYPIDPVNNPAPGRERTGAGCPTVSAPNDYCFVIAPVTVTTIDTNTIVKSVVSDSWNDGVFSTGIDKILRVGDTVTYRLQVKLHEGVTSGLVVRDALPTGLQFQSATITTSAGANFSYTMGSQPAAGATGTLAWNFGDITNQSHTPASGADVLDELIITYTAVVVTAAPPAGVGYAASTPSPNAASLAYTGGDPASTDPVVHDRLNETATVDVRQPVISAISKVDYGTSRVGSGTVADPYQVNITSDTMKFRLQACNTGLAPAYNLLITDLLPAQLNEATIVGPVVKIGTTLATATNAAPVTDYAYTLSGKQMSVAFTDARPINVNECVFVEYDIGFNNNIAPNSVWNNSAQVQKYHSLATQGGRQYGPVGPASVYMKNVLALNVPGKTIALPVAPKNTVTIGEEVRYTITVPGTPVNAALTNVVVNDVLDPALAYLSATVAGGLALTDNTSPGSQNVSLTIANIPAGQQAVITLSARVANIPAAPLATTDAGYLISNSASYVYGGVTLTSANTPNLTIVEPSVSISKSVSPGTAPTAGDTLTYTVNLTAAPAPASNAYDLVLTDSLSPGLTYKPNSALVGGVAMEPSVSGQTLTWSGLNIPAGTTVTVTYQVVVANNVVIGQSLTNTATARWTSLSGNFPYERTGTGTAPNDYVASASTTLIIGDNTIFEKVRATDTYSSADSNVRIGDVIEYELRLGLQKGTHPNIVVTDALPTGLQYVQMVSATYFGTPQATPPAPSVSGQSLTWNLGTVVNPAGSTSDILVLRYRVRVLNNDTLAQTPLNQALTNNASLAYTIGGLPVTRPAATSINVLQPMLNVSKKSAAPAGGDSIVESGELVTYTVEIQNTGTAPAYDPVLVDTLPVGMRQGQGGVVVTATSITRFNTATGATTATLPVMQPSTTTVLSNGQIVWNFDNGAPDAYTLPVGETLRVVYQVHVDPNVNAGVALTNSAQVTTYYSFDNNAVPTNAAAGDREVYGSTNALQSSVTTLTPAALQKAIPGPSAAIGVPFTYTITIPAQSINTAINDVQIHDNLALSAADLSFVSAKIVGGANLVNTGTATDLVLKDPNGPINIPAGSTLQVQITVMLLDTPKNMTAGLTFTNRAWYSYSNGATTMGSDATTGATSSSMTIVHPTLIMTKTGPATMTVGAAPTTFTLTAQNPNTSAVWNVTVTDRLPNPNPGGMCGTQPTIQSVAIYDPVSTTSTTLASAQYSTAFTANTVDYLNRPTCDLAVTLLGTSIPAGQQLIVTYRASLDDDNVNGSKLTNVAGATRWVSADPANNGHAYTATLTDGTVGTVDYQDAREIGVIGAVLTTKKTVANLTSPTMGTSAHPGDTLRYTITIQNTTISSLNNFSLVDVLDGLNNPPMFKPGSISNVTVSTGTPAVINGNTLTISGLNIGPNGTLTVTFDAVLAGVINSGTIVRNQAQLSAGGASLGMSDDPAVTPADTTDINPTQTLIVSAPLMQVLKRSQDITGDPAVLMAGDTLRYTITVKNIGKENAVNVVLRDQLPANTTYVAGSTRLNGIVVADPSPGVSPLQNGFLINAPEDLTPGAMRADASTTTTNVATITFDVVTSTSVINGTVISNQGFVSGAGGGSGQFPQTPSDDPDTTAPNDPTLDVVGNLPLVYTHKTVTLGVDKNGNNTVDPGDTLHYTIAITNGGTTPATGVALIDQVPANTTYVAGSTFIAGTGSNPWVLVPDPSPGTSPLASGIAVSSQDLIPPLPLPGAGTLSPGKSAIVTFDVTVNASALTANPPQISNQGTVATNELPTQLTDADGVPSNGYQPTVIAVGAAQVLTITKEVFVVGGGTLQAGGQLDYVVTVTNNGTVPATSVVITDNLSNFGADPYVTGSGTLNGLSAGVGYAAPVLTADYSGTYGMLAPGATAVLRFRVNVATGVSIGTTLNNTATVSWNTPSQTASASISVGVGGVPGSATVNGRAWHDDPANQNAPLPGGENRFDTGERPLAGWTVELVRNGSLLQATTTNTDGTYQFSGLTPNDTTADTYEIRFRAPAAGSNTAMLGEAHSQFSGASPAYVDSWQQISQIKVAAGANVQNLNLPIDPNGVVYNSVLRTPVAGATLTLLDAATQNRIDVGCFNEPGQQGQVTSASGYYKFDLKPSCLTGADYLIEVTVPGAGYVPGASAVIPPTTGGTTTTFTIATCPGGPDDALPLTNYCEAQPSSTAPSLAVPARTTGTKYYLRFTPSDAVIPQQSQLFNNHIPIDPAMDAAVAITKTTPLVNVSRGQLVPYTITVRSTMPATLQDLAIVDRLPPGFKYVEGSARFDGVALEPVKAGREVRWENITLVPSEKHTIKLLLIVGAGVSDSEYVNQAQVINSVTGGAASGIATATVRVVPDPTFDCTDIIGKVFDDANLNGVQDEGEKGLQGVRVISARGLIATTDKHGRYHITCAAVPNESRGSNFILKVDDRSLPGGYRLTTENPLVKRVTRGKAIKFNFGAAIHHLVRLDVADGVFEPGTTEMRPQWLLRIDLLLNELRKQPSVLHLSYLADTEAEGLVRDRLKVLEAEIEKRWAQLNCCYRLTTETEVFWRRGAPAVMRSISE